MRKSVRLLRRDTSEHLRRGAGRGSVQWDRSEAGESEKSLLTKNLPLVLKPSPSALAIFTCKMFVFMFIFELAVYLKFGDRLSVMSSTFFFLGLLCISSIFAFVGLISLKPTSIDKNGIISPKYCRDHVIRWSEITNIYVLRLGGQEFLCLNVASTVPVTQISKMNKIFKYGDVNISTYGTGISITEVQHLIERLASEERPQILGGDWTGAV